MFGLGLWDDLCELCPAAKLSGQLVGASLFILAGGTFSLTGNPVLNQLVTYFWFIGIINAVNMLDNMDGLASGVVIISIVTLILLTLGVADRAPAEYFGIQLSLMLAAALAGFWLFNRHPASIFMGDSGSLSIGYLVAGLAVPTSLNGYLGLVSTTNVSSILLALIIPAMALVIPIFDTTFVSLTRKWRAQPASQGGRDHSSHRLVCLGLTECAAVRVLYAISGVGGMLALFMQQFPRQTLPLLVVFLSTLMVSGLYLGRVKIADAAPAKEAPRPAGSEQSSNRTLISSLERIPTSAGPHASEAR
jgi:UDP-GlcNAc:undecaprenyl-phosphate GlcNAc-1-phosphate transferase